MGAYTLQAINTLHDKRFGRTRLFAMCIATANRKTDHEYIVPVYKQASYSYYRHPDAHVHA